MQGTDVLAEIRASQPMINDNKLGNMTRPLELNGVFGTNDNKLGNMTHPLELNGVFGTNDNELGNMNTLYKDYVAS